MSNFITGLQWPADMVIKGNDLYFIDAISYKIFKTNINDTTPSVIEVATLTNQPYRLLFNGDDLYISTLGGLLPGKILKINTAQINPIIEEIISSGLYAPDGLALRNNYLYICESGVGKVYKIDITVINPVLIDVVAGLSQPSAIMFLNNYLYITEVGAGKISRININDSNPTITNIVTGFNSPTGLATHDNFLYITEGVTAGVGGTGKILRIDLNNITPVITVFLTGLNFPRMILFNNNDLFIAESGAGKILRSNQILSIDDEFSQLISLFPNPSADYIQFSNLKSNATYSVYNTLGAEVMKGIILENEKIDIQTLSNGLYLIQINGRFTTKFIKQ